MLLISLIGHYERTAQHLAGADGLRSYPSVDGPFELRVKARSAGSLLRAVVVIAHHVLRRSGALIGIPRSNSRAIRLLTRLFPRTPVFSYSDGLGDSVHSFYLQSDARYLGHVGFSGLSGQPLIHTIALEQCVEPWQRWIEYAPGAPMLVVLKTPKEVSLDPLRVARLYARAVAALRRRGPIVLSGAVEGLSGLGLGSLEQIGPLARLSSPLPVSGAVGLPSTAFLTLAAKLPLQSLRVLRLGCARGNPEAHRKNLVMKQTLDRALPAVHALF